MADDTRQGDAFWLDEGITREDVLSYYRAVAPVMLPYFADRPVTLRVFPGGAAGASYYEREAPPGAEGRLRTVAYALRSADRVARVPIVDDEAGLLWLAGRALTEFHLWNARLPDLDRPDQAVFDLDPGDRASFGDVLAVALRLRDELAKVGVVACAKTSGRTGVHVHVPLAVEHPFDVVRAWVKAVAERLAAGWPRLIGARGGATHEGGLVTIDYAQNSVARSMAAPYAIRAAPGAPVSAPLTWDEVAAGRVRPGEFTVRTMPDRRRAIGDPFARVLEGAQRLPV